MAAEQTKSQSSSFITNPRLAAVDDVEIDSNGTFKYILIKVHDLKIDEDSKYVVRGTAKAEYHADIFDMVAGGIESNGVECEVVGGGRIEHQPSKKTIKVYGYSVGYGKADHSISCEILKKKYTDYSITWSDEGY